MRNIKVFRISAKKTRTPFFNGVRVKILYYGLTGVTLWSPGSSVRECGVRFDEPIAQRADILLGVIAAQADAYCSVDNAGVKPDGFEHVAARALLAGGAAGNIDPARFEEVHEDLAAPAGERDAEDVRRCAR